jgi:LPS export ABC transporter protein LptC
VNRFTISLTAVFVLLAVSCQEPKSPPVVRGSVLPDSAEQMMFGMNTNLTDAGVRHGEVHADTAYSYDQNTRFEMRRVNATFYTATGEKNATLTSLAGTYRMRTGSMEARGNVVVTSTDGRKLESPELKYDPTRNEISSDSAFTFTTPQQVVQGIGFVSDPQMHRIQILRKVQASGKAVAIPKR